GAVRLPDLDHRAADRRAVFVEHLHPEVDQLSDGLLFAVAGDVRAEELEALRRIQRSGELGERGRTPDQRLRRVAQRRLRIAGDDARRLRALVARLDHGGHGVDSLKALVDDVNYERGYRGYALRMLRARWAAARAGLRADRHEARPGRALRRDRLPARRGDLLLESEGC